MTDARRLQSDLNHFLSTLSSSNEQNKQLLLHQLQSYLSKLFAMNVRFQSIDDSRDADSIDRRSVSSSSETTLNLARVDYDQSSLTPIPSPTSISSTSCTDLGKWWKFSNILRTRFEMSLIASNSQSILCYHQQTSLLHFILVTGQFQDNIRWKHESITDLLWYSLHPRPSSTQSCSSLGVV